MRRDRKRLSELERQAKEHWNWRCRVEVKWVLAGGEQWAFRELAGRWCQDVEAWLSGGGHPGDWPLRQDELEIQAEIRHLEALELASDDPLLLDAQARLRGAAATLMFSVPASVWGPLEGTRLHEKE